MRFFVAVGSFSILVSMLWVSFTHGMMLFEKFGYQGQLAILGTFAIEFLYVLASALVVYQKGRGQKIRPNTIITFVFASAMVGWSNVSSGWAFGIGGILMGVAVPITIILSKSLFLDAVASSSQKDSEVENHSYMETPSKAEMDNLSKVISSTPTDVENCMENSSNMETPDLENKLETSSKVEVEYLSKKNISTPTKGKNGIEIHFTPAMENPFPSLKTTRVESVDELEKKDTPTNMENTSSKENTQVENGEIESLSPMESGKMEPPVKNNPSNMDMENHTPMVEVEKKKPSKLEKKKSSTDIKNEKVEADPME